MVLAAMITLLLLLLLSKSLRNLQLSMFLASFAEPAYWFRVRFKISKRFGFSFGSPNIVIYGYFLLEAAMGVLMEGNWLVFDFTLV
jgi:uncharacterized membrane protein YjjB (DUF3815 family)